MRIFGNLEIGRAEGLWLAALFVGSLLFYSQTLGFDFVRYDDQPVLQDHPTRYDETSLAKSARAIFVDHYPREEPLVIRDLSWALDARLFGFANPFGYHVGNVALNAFVVGLIFLWLRRLRFSSPIAGAVTLAFAILPIHVEPVAWVMGRKDLLFAFFAMVALHAQQTELEAESTRTKAIAYGVAFTCVLLALGSKISAVSLWLVLGLHRLFHPYLMGHRRAGEAFEWASDLRRTLLPVLPQLIASLVVFAWYRGVIGEFGIIEIEGEKGVDAEHLFNMLRFAPLIAGEYVKHVFIPSELSAYYRWPHVAIPLTTPQLLASVAWGVGLVAMLGFLLWRRRDLAFYPLMIAALLVPYSGLFYVGFWHADRYFYLASAPCLALTALLSRELVARMPNLERPVLASLGALVLLQSAQAWNGQARWRDAESLWLYEATREEPALIAFNALARYYAEEAERAATPEMRIRLAKRSRAIGALGLDRYEALGLIDTPYAIPEKNHYARIHALAGRADHVLGAPPAVRAGHYRRAYAAHPESVSALLLALALAEQGGVLPPEEAQPVIEESFEYFLAFVQFVSDERDGFARSTDLLERNYASRYPYLEPRVEALRSALIQ